MYDHQLRDFYATKMVFEDQLRCTEAEDPDSTDLFSRGGVAAGRNPRAQLSAILKQGGGVRLAYKLMSTELHTLCVREGVLGLVHCRGNPDGDP